MGRDSWLLVASGFFAALAGASAVGVNLAVTVNAALGVNLREAPADATGDGIELWQTVPVGIPCSQPEPCSAPAAGEGNR